MKKASIVSIILIIAMVIGSLSGCGKTSKNAASPDNAGSDSSEAKTGDSSGAAGEEPYEVSFMYPVSGTFADQDKVNEAINELALKEINMKVNVIPITFGTRDEQLQLMLTSGEALDIFPQNSYNMATYVDSGYVVDLNEYTNSMPNTLKWVGMDDLKCCNVGGYIWGVTTMRERANPNGIIMRTDILKELGFDPDKIITLDDVTKVFAAVKKAHPDMIVFGGTNTATLPSHSDQANSCDPLNDELGVLEDYGQSLKVVNEYETKEFTGLVKQMRQWWNAGYISKDMPTCTDTGETLMAAGKLFSYEACYKPNTVAEKKSQTGYDVSVIKVSEPLCTTTSTNGLGYCVASTAKDPAKAVQFLDWAEGSGELNDLLNFGVEGVDWVEGADGTATFPQGVTLQNCGYHLDWGWAIPNQFAGHLWEGNDADLYDQYKAFRDNAHKSKAYGFCFDSSSVTDQIIACKTVTDKYMTAICTGSVDPDTELKKMNKELYDAGLQDIMNEKQKQLDAWLAENK